MVAAFLEGKVQELCSRLTWCHLDEPRGGRRKRWHSRRAYTEPLSRMSSDRRATFRWTTSSGWRKLSAFRYTNSSLRTARNVDCSLRHKEQLRDVAAPCHERRGGSPITKLIQGLQSRSDATAIDGLRNLLRAAHSSRGRLAAASETGDPGLLASRSVRAG